MGIRFRVAPGVSLGFGVRGTTLGFSGGGVSYTTNLTAARRRSERDAARAARATEEARLAADQARRLSKVDMELRTDGEIIVLDADGGLVVGRELDLVWECLGDQMEGLLARGLERVNGEAERLTGIHLDTPAPASYQAPSASLFREPAPSFLRPPPSREPEPVPRAVAPLGWLSRRFRHRRERHAADRAAALLDHEDALREWSETAARQEADHAAAVAAHNLASEAWSARRASHEAAEAARIQAHERAIRTDPAFMEASLAKAVGDLDWPRETLVGIEIAEDARTAILDVDLPEIEDMPAETASLARDGRRLAIKPMTERAQREAYAAHIHGILFRIAGATLATLPGLERVIVSGYSQRLDRATGRVEDHYLVSAAIDHDGWSRIAFERLSDVDPVEAIAAFPMRRKMSATGIFKPVEPFDMTAVVEQLPEAGK